MRKLGKEQQAVLASLKEHRTWNTSDYARSGWVWTTNSETLRIMKRLVELGYVKTFKCQVRGDVFYPAVNEVSHDLFRLISGPDEYRCHCGWPSNDPEIAGDYGAYFKKKSVLKHIKEARSQMTIKASTDAHDLASIVAELRKKNEFIPPELWGKDHFSTLAYVETRCVDHQIKKTGYASIDRRHMRVDASRHPQFAHEGNENFAAKYPTRLVGKIMLENHDDYDCLYDMEAAEVIELGGTGLQPVVKLTPKGNVIATRLRDHLKTTGGSLGSFRYTDTEQPS